MPKTRGRREEVRLHYVVKTDLSASNSSFMIAVKRGNLSGNECQVTRQWVFVHSAENYRDMGRGAEKERGCEGLLTKDIKANGTLVLLDSSPFTPQLKGARLHGSSFLSVRRKLLSRAMKG